MNTLTDLTGRLESYGIDYEHIETRGDVHTFELNTVDLENFGDLLIRELPRKGYEYQLNSSQPFYFELKIWDT